MIPNTLTKLGYCRKVEFYLDDEFYILKLALKDKYVLASDSKGKTLYIFKTKRTMQSKRFDQKQIEKCMALYERWSEFEADTANVCKVKTPKLKITAEAVSLHYKSDKWDGKAKDHIHHFSSPVKIKLDRLDDPQLIKFSGGKLRVKADGVTG